MKQRILTWSCFVALALPAATANASTLASSTATVAAVPNVRLADLGAVQPQMPAHLVVILRCQHEDDLDAFVAERGDPGSLVAQRSLTAQQFEAWFSPSPETYERVAQAFERDGFRIERTYANRTVLDLAGPAASVERTFDTQLHRVRAGRFVGFANLRPATIPAELVPYVEGVVGFDNLPMLHTFMQRGTHQNGRVGPLFGPDTGYSPMILRKAYDLPVQHQVGPGKGYYDGRGQSAGIVIDSDVLNSDVAGFLKYFGVFRKQSIVRVPVDGGGGGRPDPEATLDVETIAGLAPGAGIVLYLIPSLSSTATLDAFAQANSDDTVSVLNNSWGGCETQESPRNYPQMTNQLAKEGAALGIVYVAATGDNGVNECPSFPPQPLPWGVSAPASGSSFVAVGATTLYVNLKGQTRTQYGWWGSAGGFSSIFPKPQYQKIPPIRFTNRHRSLPDVAFDGDPGTGVSFYWMGAWQGPIGGTSLAAPTFCALTVELEQIHGGRIGNLLPNLYSIYQKDGYGSAFTDMTYGFNGFYYATTGFDRVTGIGTIDGWKFGEAASL